jgi:predicted RNA-binding protein YlxR (DUF448 family)
MLEQMTKGKKTTSPVKHVPQRTCVMCRKNIAKRQLVRLVCVEGEGVEIDATGRKAGRGAYLCPTAGCWESALKSGKLEFALRTHINPENRDRLIEHAKGLNNTTR